VAPDRTHRVDELGWLRACLTGLIAATIAAAGFRSGVYPAIVVAVVAALAHDRFLERLILRRDEVVRFGAFRRRRIALGDIRSVDVTGRPADEDADVDGRSATLRVVAGLRGGGTAALAWAGSIPPDDLLMDLSERGVPLSHAARVLLDEPRLRRPRSSPEDVRKVIVPGLVVISGMLGGIVGSIPF
jgi:hypothetical protein